MSNIMWANIIVNGKRIEAPTPAPSPLNGRLAWELYGWAGACKCRQQWLHPGERKGKWTWSSAVVEVEVEVEKGQLLQMGHLRVA